MSLHENITNDSQKHFARGWEGGANNTVSSKNQTGQVEWIDRIILPSALSFDSSIIAPTTEVDGDIYIIGNESGNLDVDTVTWISGTTVRYTFNGSPSLAAYAALDYLVITTSTNATNNGTYIISTVNTGSFYIEVTNALRSDATDDEATDSPSVATVTFADWDGAAPNSWVKFDGTNWNSIAPVIGMLCYIEDATALNDFSGVSWSAASAETLATTLAAGNTSGANDIIMTSGQAINSSTGGGELNLRDGADDVITITSDNGGQAESGLYVDTVQSTIFADGWNRAFDLESTGDIAVYNTTTQKAIRIKNGTNGATEAFYAFHNTLGAGGTNDSDGFALALNSRNATINTNVTNSAAVTGVSITVKTDDTLYANQLSLQPSSNLFDGILVPPALSADRTWTFPNTTGTVALTSQLTTEDGIYDGSGSLSGATVVTQAANTLAFTGSVANMFSVDGTTLSVDGNANSVGIGTAAPDADAILDITSTTLAVKMPIVTTTNRDLLTGSQGLLLFNDTTNLFNFHNGSGWKGLLQDDGTGATNRVARWSSATAVSGSALLFDDGTNFGVGKLSGLSAHIQSEYTTAATNSPVDMLRMEHISSGTPANGNGTAILMGAESVGGQQKGNRFRHIMSDATGITGQWSFDVHEGGSSKSKVLSMTGTNIGFSTETFGTSATKTLGIGIGVAPSTEPAGMIQVYAKDSSAGATDATIGLGLETDPIAIGTFTASHKIPIWINSVEYHISLDAV